MVQGHLFSNILITVKKMKEACRLRRQKEYAVPERRSRKQCIVKKRQMKILLLVKNNKKEVCLSFLILIYRIIQFTFFSQRIYKDFFFINDFNVSKHKNIIALNVLSDLKIRRMHPSKQINFHVGRQPFFFHPPHARPSHASYKFRRPQTPPQTTKVKIRRVAALTKTRLKVSARRVGG